MHKLNANENNRLLEVAGNIVTPIMEGAGSENILTDSSVMGLAVAPVTPALALAH